MGRKPKHANQRIKIAVERAWKTGSHYCPCCGTLMFFANQQTERDFRKRYRAETGTVKLPPKALAYFQATSDHIIPRSQGGTHNFKNLVVMCGRCNVDKNTDTIPMFIKRRRDRGEPVPSSGESHLRNLYRQAKRFYAEQENPND